MNIYGDLAIYRFEMSRTRRTLIQSIVAPVIPRHSTSLFSERRSAQEFRRLVASATGRSLCQA